jgi:hypothetical protein
MIFTGAVLFSVGLVERAGADVGPGGEWVVTGPPGTLGSLVTLLDGTAALVGQPVQRYHADTGVWTTTGSLLGSGGVATVLPSSKVLVTGLSPTEVYDPATATSALTGAMIIPRTRHQAILLQSGNVLVSGGTDANGQLAGPAELYHSSSGTWMLTGALNNPRTDHTAILLPTGKVLIAGGFGMGVRFTSVELYDAASGTWAVTSPNAVGGSVSALLPGGQALVIGTDNLGSGSPAFPASQFYDPATGMWSVPIVFSQDFALPSTLGTLTDGRVLLAARSQGLLCQPFMYLFDPGTGAWTSASKPPLQGFDLGASGPGMTILPDGRALLVGPCSRTLIHTGLILTAELFRPDNSTPRLAVTPSTGDFGTVAIGSSTQETIAVQNTGQAQLNGSATLSGDSSPSFQLLTGAVFTLGPGATSAALVRFTASDFGSFAGSVSFMSNGGWASLTLKANVGVQLSGTITGADGLALASIPVEIHGASSSSTTSDANGHYSFFVRPNGAYTIIPASPSLTFIPSSRSVPVGTSNIGGLGFVATSTPPPKVPSLLPGFPADYDGDGKADIAVYRPSTGSWFIIQSSNGAVRAVEWGAPRVPGDPVGDIPVPGDYDGDGKDDITAYRPSTGFWFIIQSSNGAVRAQQWGAGGDVPMPGDYDGDGKTDIAVYRPSTGTWFILNSSTGGVRSQQWGAASDRPVPGDYDGDGKADIAVYRPSSGTWHIIQSSNGTVRAVQWGAPRAPGDPAGDIPVPGDYDGDGKTDIAVYRPSTGVWFIIQSSNGAVRAQQWGAPRAPGDPAGDIPVPGDYDGDGKTDIAVYRPSTGEWFIIRSSTGTVQKQQWGAPDDQPIPEWF